MSEPIKQASEKQAALLRCFGRSAGSAKEAHEAISEILALPLAEQARLRLRQFEDLHRAEDHPQASHDVLFQAACVLVHGYDLSEGEAFPVLREYANRSDQPWSDHEVNYKLRSARNATHTKPRGYLIIAPDRPAPAGSGAARTAGEAAGGAPVVAPAPRAVYSPRKLVAFAPELLAKHAAKWRGVVNVEWLANRSAADLSGIGPTKYLEGIYRPGEKVVVFSVYRSQGQALWPKEEIPVAGEEGVWYLAQPVNGESLPNPRTGKMSRRSMESVTEFRYLVLESDQAEARDWLGLIVQLPLRIEAIYSSGGKSVHALVRVDCATHRQWEDYMRGLLPTLNLLGLAGVDAKTLTSVRLTRLPGCLRAGRLQKLLFFLPQRGPADVRPICELPAGRDVVVPWLEQARLVVDGHAESTRELRRALDYYAPCNRDCRQALADIDPGGN